MNTLKQASNARYYAKNKEAVNSRRRAKYADNPEENLAKQHQSYMRHRNKRLSAAKNRYELKGEAINSSLRMKWATDEEYRTKLNIKNKVARYGITVEDYLEMYRQADGACAACGNRPETRSLHIDHDHATGQVRGLLCHHCNTALGLLKDDPEIIKKLLKYLIIFIVRR